MNRPTMTNEFRPYTAPKTSGLPSLGSIVRFVVILGVVAGVGYLVGDSLGLWDLTAGSTVERIQDQRADERAVMEMLRGN